MKEHHLTLNPELSLAEEPHTGHNRWHEGIEPRLRIEPGDIVVVDTRDALDGQLDANSTADAIPGLSFDVLHPLSGPIYVEGAEPGDLLEIHVHHIEPDPWTRTATQMCVPGFAVLPTDFEEPFLAVWRLAEDGTFAESDQLPGIRIPAEPFIGTLGIAPSREDRIRLLEQELPLVEQGLALPQPQPVAAIPATDAVMNEGLRSLPPRLANGGGNIDLRQATAGITYQLRVNVEGALISMGDVHFAQGDGELGGTALEMRSRIRLSCKLVKGGAKAPVRLVRHTEFGAPRYAAPQRLLATVGSGPTAAEAMVEAVRAMLAVIGRYGYTPLQAYALCTAAVGLRLIRSDQSGAVVAAGMSADVFVDPPRWA